MAAILRPDDGYRQVGNWLRDAGIGKIFLVCDPYITSLRVNSFFEGLDIPTVRFSGFKPNPDQESVTEGVELFQSEKCDSIVAVGGGSAMDVAKCVKLHAAKFRPFLAVPTTAGTGSEATRFAVIYKDGVKQSVTDNAMIPDAVLMDPSVLDSLPEYQRKATAMDAFCHAVESFWSVNSTQESKEYSRKALRLLLDNLDRYIGNDSSVNGLMLEAANMAGRAINITQTTAGHAMCYKLTSLYGISHGHAAAICVTKLWPYMLEHTSDCADPRGEDFLKGTFEELAAAMDCGAASEAPEKFSGVLAKLGLTAPTPKCGDIDVLVSSVNPDRLRNTPVALDDKAIRGLYEKILRK